MPPPMPKIALIIASPPAISSRGNVSRTIPNASGKTPPATPCSTRPAITTLIEPASALTTAPALNRTSTAVSTRPLPKRAPSLPTIGVAIEALRRNPVSTHETVDGLAPNSLASEGSAGTTRVWESENAMQASASVSRTEVGRRSGTRGAYVASAPGALELVEQGADLLVHRAPEDGEQR